MSNIKVLEFNKTFKTFKEGAEELRELVPVLNLYLGFATDNDEKEIRKNLISIIASDIPGPQNKTYPKNFGLNIKATEVSFRTKEFINFGWRIAKENNEDVYIFRVSVVSRLNNPQQPSVVINDLIDKEWSQSLPSSKPKQEEKQQEVKVEEE